MPIEPTWDESVAVEDIAPTTPRWENTQPAPAWDETIPVEDYEARQPSPSLQPVVPAPNAPLETAFAPVTNLDLARQQIVDQQSTTLAEGRAQERARFTPAQIERLDTGSLATTLMNAPPGLEAPMVALADILTRFPTMTKGNAKVLAGILQTAAGAWNFAASPVGAAATATGALAAAPGLAGLAGKAVLGTFAVEAFANTPGAIEQFDTAMRSGDPEQIARTASALALNTVVALGASKGAAETLKIVPVQEAAAASRAAVRETAIDLGQPAPKPPRIDALDAATTTSRQSAPLGITPPGSQFLQSVIDFFTPRTPLAMPEVRIDSNARLPRLQPYEAEKLIATTPEGMGRVPGLGRVVDPRASATDAADMGIITRAYSVSKGKTFAALWGQSQWRSKDLFRADESGTIALTNGERGYISDVIEAEIRNPGSQSITPEQRSWITDEWLPLRDDVTRMLVEEGVTRIETEDLAFDPARDYFPRPAIGKENRPEATPRSQTGGRPGADPFFVKSRLYETEFEGARPPRANEQKEQIVYDPDAISRVTKFVSGAYRAVADQRLANDASLGGRTIAERFTELQAQHEGRLAALPEDARIELEAQLHEQAAHPIWGKEKQLNIAPAFQGRIFPIEAAQKLESAYGSEIRGWVRTTSDITGAMKAMAATLDASAPWIQGAAMMGSNPIRWARATWNSYRALLNPDVMGQMLERPHYMEAASEFTQSGGTLLQLEDFLAGMQGGAAVTRIPVYGAAVKAAGRSYGTFIDLAKLELWEAWKHTTPREQWPQLAESLENALFMGRMEKIGVNPHQAIGERLMLFAPIYYRGAGNLVASAFMRGVSGKTARHMLAGYAAAGGLVTMASWLALGLSEDEIIERLDPSRGTFLKVPVSTGDGKQIEVGIGNILTQLVRLTGRAADYHGSDSPIDTGIENNPYLQFLSARAAFLPSLAIDIVRGEDYRGNRLPVSEAVTRRFLPFAFQSLFPNEDVPTSQRLADAAFTAFGLNAYPESDYAAQLRHMDEAAQTQHGKPFLALDLRERAVAVRDFQARPGFKKRDPTPQDMRRFLKIAEEREASLRARLDSETRTRLDTLGLPIGTYKSTVTLQGIDVPLSAAEQTRYEELLAESYAKHTATIPREASNASDIQRRKWWGGYQEEIREAARRKLMSEMAAP